MKYVPVSKGRELTFDRLIGYTLIKRIVCLLDNLLRGTLHHG